MSLISNLTTVGSGGMGLEQTVLALGVVLGLVHIVAQSMSSLLHRGFSWASGPRDETPPPNLIAGRLERASKNFQETFPFLIALVVLISLTGKSGLVSQTGAVLWLIGRIVYLPAYATGSNLRPFAFILALTGLMTLLISLFL